MLHHNVYTKFNGGLSLFIQSLQRSSQARLELTGGLILEVSLNYCIELSIADLPKRRSNASNV